MKRIMLFALILFITLPGCEKKKDIPETAGTQKPTTAVELQLPIPKLLFQEPIKAHRFELPSEALQVWRHSKSVKPALVLFSAHPFLDRVAEERKADVSELIRTGGAETFKQRGSYFRVNPALVSTQTLSAAIDNEILSRIIMVIPTRVDMNEFSLEIFSKQMVDAGFMTKEEGDKLSYANGTVSGNVRSLPFLAVHPDALPKLKEPVVIHFDTGYFKGLFKNEVATPLYDILNQTVSRIRQAEWKVYAATFSFSTIEMMYSLDVRFLISALAKMIEDPQLLQKMPPAWRLHADAMYMGNMYMESKSRDVIEEAAVTAPDDPIIVYALSQVRFQQGRAEEAFTLLDKAVQLDPGYGVAYLQLALTGAEKNQSDKSLELQRKAIKLYPENPFIQINEANFLIQMNRTDEAIQTINGLQSLPWSSYFHANAIKNLDGMEEYARNPQPVEATETMQEKK